MPRAGPVTTIGEEREVPMPRGEPVSFGRVEPPAAVELCPRCGAQVARDDDYCTHCGERVDGGGATVLAIGRAAREPQPVTRAGRRLERRSWLLGLALLGAVAIAALLGAAYYRSELDAAKTDLAASEQQVVRLDTARARLAAELSGSKRLSERRAAVLRRANGVLVGVDPLLSSVDELKANTSRIQSARDDFLEASGDAIVALIDLGNYLIETGPSADPAEVDALIDDANAAIDDARSYVSKLAAVDGKYAAAAKRFDLRASRLSRDVEALRQELKAVAGS
jgi:hypothetical protein